MDAGYDARVTPARADIAATALKGKVGAPRYVDGVSREVIDPVAPVRAEPRPDAPLLTEALKGERVSVYDSDAEGWAWGQLASDGYVGYMPANALAVPARGPTHKVTVPRTLVFPGPSIKDPPLEALPLGARICVTRVDGRMAVTATGAYVPAVHLAALDVFADDFVAVAEYFAGVPYLWGGKTALGLDCSGLVQVALTACGLACPRDSDMQERALGETVAVDPATFERGDLVFWKGHVAIVRDREHFIHANAWHMAVAVEPIADAVARIQSAGSAVTSVKRL